VKETPGKRQTFLEELLELDKQLLRIVVRRGRLLRKASRRGVGTTGVEKTLWRIWEDEASRFGKDPAQWRRVFSMLQELTIRDVESVSDGYGLSPGFFSADVDMTGPGSRFQARLWCLLAAQSSDAIQIPGAVTEDPLVELLKALNQVGGHLYWDEEGVKSRGTETLSFLDKAVFAGEDPFNLYALIWLALAREEHVKFTGGAGLKLLDLGPLKRLLPAMGARLVNVAPRCAGTPVRLEASGVLPNGIVLPEDLPEEAIMALVAVAPSFPGGLSLSRAGGKAMPEPVAEVVRFLRQCGVAVEEEGGALRVGPGPLTLPKRQKLNLDPFLSAWLLALPRFAGGKVRLVGRWPGHMAEAQAAEALLRAAGVKLKVGKERVDAHTEGVSSSGGARLDTSSVPDYFPLSLALAAALRKSTPSEQVIVSDIPETGGPAGEFLSRIGYMLRPLEGGVKGGVEDGAEVVEEVVEEFVEEVLEEVGPDAEADAAEEVGPDTVPEAMENTGESSAELPWVSPGPHWSMGFALAAFVRPGITLTNPGGVASIWPGFWNLYNALSGPVRDGSGRKKAIERENDAPEKPRGRRIRMP
jgi:3-phosphoshikimate 1-carboxyvinyltransferase